MSRCNNIKNWILEKGLHYKLTSITLEATPQGVMLIGKKFRSSQ